MTYQEVCNKILEIKQEIIFVEDEKDKVQRQINVEKEKWEAFKTVFYKEKRDLEEIQKNSLGTIVLKIAKAYDKRYEKEYKEYIEAKAKYDAFETEIEFLEEEKTKYQTQFIQLKNKLNEYENKKRQEYPEGRELQKQEEEQKNRLYKEKKELQEAIDAVNKVYHLAKGVHKEYQSANNWATYDTFFGGGIIGDLAKYSKMDEAAKLVNQMKSASKRMEQELNDVAITFNESIDSVEGGVRIFDIAFDNIFTDWSVKSRIKENISKIENYISKLERILSVLRGKMKRVEDGLKEL